MARWKSGDGGAAYYDPNDDGPDQVAVPSGYNQDGSKQESAPAPAPDAPVGGKTGPYTSPYGNEWTPQGATVQQAPADQTQQAQPSLADFQRDYWAPDRDQVLASMQPGAQAAAQPAAAKPSYAAMEGVDVNKLNDAGVTSPKYTASRILASGGSLADAAKAIGATVLDGTRMRLATGEVIDTRRDEEGANALQWLVMGDPNAPQGGGAAGATAVGSGAVGAGGASGSTGANDFTSQVRSLLMQQLGGLSGPLTADDPQIKAEMDAQRNELERNRRDRRSADAERGAMQGLLNGGQSSGSFDQNVASGFEDKGRQLSSVQSQLFTRELQSRRTQMSQLMQMALQSGDAESARSLQMQLAQMDDALRRLGLQQNQSQWNDSFGLNAAQFQYGKDKDLATYGSGAT